MNTSIKISIFLAIFFAVAVLCSVSLRNAYQTGYEKGYKESIPENTSIIIRASDCKDFKGIEFQLRREEEGRRFHLYCLDLDEETGQILNAKEIK